jgi:hypothetical protein
VSSLFNQQVTWQSFASGFASSLVGGAVNVATNSNPWATLAVGTMAGGISSTITGGSFLEGAAIGLAVTGFNHLMHGGWEKQGNDNKSDHYETKRIQKSFHKKSYMFYEGMRPLHGN